MGTLSYREPTRGLLNVPDKEKNRCVQYERRRRPGAERGDRRAERRRRRPGSGAERRPDGGGQHQPRVAAGGLLGAELGGTAPRQRRRLLHDRGRAQGIGRAALPRPAGRAAAVTVVSADLVAAWRG